MFFCCLIARSHRMVGRYHDSVVIIKFSLSTWERSQMPQQDGRGGESFFFFCGKFACSGALESGEAGGRSEVAHSLGWISMLLLLASCCSSKRPLISGR